MIQIHWGWYIDKIVEFETKVEIEVGSLDM